MGDLLYSQGGGISNGGDEIDDDVESTFGHSTVALPATRHLQQIQQCHSSLDSSDQST